MKSRLTGLVVLLLTVTSLGLITPVRTADASPTAETSPSSAARAPFKGTWRLLSFETRLSDGSVTYPFGTDAQGIVNYTPDGRMAVAVWKANRTPFAVNDLQLGTPEEYTAAMKGYIQYMGTVTVDREHRTVHHKVDSSVFPNWVGSTQSRFYEFNDDGTRLVLSTPPIQFGGVTAVGALVWERVETTD